VNKEKILKEVYNVFGDNLPQTRSDYGAYTTKPVEVLSINKAFKNWRNFLVEYKNYAISQRNEKATKKIVTKEGVKK
jgi:hypothetical protein